MPGDLADLQKVIKTKLSDALFKRQALYSKKAILPDALPFLMLSLKELSSDLNFLKEFQIPDDLKKHYLERFAQESDSWEPLWKTLYTNVESFHNAFKYYHVALRFIERDRLDLSEEAIKDSRKELKKLIDEYRKQLPAEKLYALLLRLYVDALSQDPLQQSSVLYLAKFQRELSLFFFDSPTALAPVQENLNSSLEALSQGKPGSRADIP